MKASPLVLRLPLEGNPQEAPPINVYAFDRRGKLLATSPLQDGQATLSLDEEQTRHARLLVGPPPADRKKPPTLDELERRAYRPQWHYRPGTRDYELVEIPRLDWERWWIRRCRVRGRVVRPMVVLGTLVERPLCHVRVHVCEVDPWFLFLERLPDGDLFHLRDELLRRIEEYPIPIPEPDPIPDPIGPIAAHFPRRLLEVRAAKARLGEQLMLNPQPLPPRERRSFDPQPDPPHALRQAGAIGRAAIRRPRTPGDERMLNPQPLPPREGRPSVQRTMLPPEATTALYAPSALHLRESLVRYLPSYWPWLCGIHWFWRRYRCDEIALFETDHDGRFDGTIHYTLFGDHPDLYFWVEAFIGGAWVTVYRPAIGCHTYWDYECGRAVTLRVTDPRALPCNDPQTIEGVALAIVGPGGTNVRAIVESGARQGQLPSVGGIPFHHAFGGTVQLYALFGDDLMGHGVTHYRWSWRPLGAPSSAWQPLGTTLFHSYRVVSGGGFTVKPFLVGPDPAQSEILFKVPPADPPEGEWLYRGSNPYGLLSATLDTTALRQSDGTTNHGAYELKLELFHNEGGSMVPATLPDAPESTQVPPVALPATPPAGGVAFENAPEHYRYRPGGPGTALRGMRFVLYVDNAPCDAEIAPVAVPGSTTSCGFIVYPEGSDPSVTLGFLAHQPREFATFSFDVVKGDEADFTVADSGGWIGGASSDHNGYGHSAGHDFSRAFQASQLLGDCPRAAFGMYLAVHALITDGWNRLYTLDRSDMEAFALAPQGPDNE